MWAEKSECKTTYENKNKTASSYLVPTYTVGSVRVNTINADAVKRLHRLPELRGQLDGQFGQVLLDCGASHGILSEEFVNRIGYTNDIVRDIASMVVFDGSESLSL